MSTSQLQEGRLNPALEDHLKAGRMAEYFRMVSEYETAGNVPAEFYKNLLDRLRFYKEDALAVKYPEWLPICDLEIQRMEYLQKRLPSGENDDYDADILGLHWLDVCRDLRTPDRALYFLLSGRNREEEIANELFQQPDKKLRKFYAAGLGKHYVPSAIRFFLRMYNLPEAWRLVRKIRKTPDDEQESPGRSRRLYGVAIFSMLALILLVLNAIDASFFGAASWSNLLHRLYYAWPTCASNYAQFSSGRTALAAIYLLMLIALPLALFTPLHIFFRLFLPRLIGGIVVGYMVLIFSNDVWIMIDRLFHSANYPANCVVIIVLATAFAFFFLLNEVRQTIRNSSVALMRSALIWLMGIFQALVIGLVLSDLFGSGMSPAANSGMPGIFGNLYPRFILISAPLALLIGIFVQIIWEDKPITEPF